MPRYDYRCENCGEKFEVSLTLEEREKKSEKKNCPQCQSEKTHQLMTFNGGVVGNSSKSSGGSAGGGRPTGGCPTGGCPFM